MKNKKILISVLSTLMIASSLTSCKGNQLADKVVIGNIYTGEETNKYVEAIAIKEDKIIYVGDSKSINKYIGNGTEVTKYENGELITAGLFDGHTHLTEIKVAEADKLLKFEKGYSKQDCVDAVAQYIKENPELTFITGTGWELGPEFGLDDPTSKLLDQIDTDLPILLYAADGHSIWVNTILMNKASINKNTVTPEGGVIVKDSDGNPTGCFKDTAKDLITAFKEEKPESSYIDGVLASEEFILSTGYVARFQAYDNEDTDLTKTPVIDYYEKLDKEGKLSTYTQTSFKINNVENAVELVDNAIALRDTTKGGNHEMTTVKIFMDGIIENGGAYLEEAYEINSSYYGTPLWGSEESIIRLSKVIAKANEAGMSVHFHTMGDKAINDALKAIELADDQIGVEKVIDARNALVHLALVSDTAYAKFEKYGVVAVLNPWAYKDPAYYDVQISLIGEERTYSQYPYKSFINSNVHIAFGTDYGASYTYDPIECFHVLTTRVYNTDDASSLLNGDEKLSREETINAMTSGVAYQLKKEKELGTIAIGKYANLTVFNKDILTIPDSEIMSTKIEKVMSQGNWYIVG